MRNLRPWEVTTFLGQFLASLGHLPVFKVLCMCTQSGVALPL